MQIKDGRRLSKDSVYNNIHKTPIRRAAAALCVPKIPILQNQVTTELSLWLPKEPIPRAWSSHKRRLTLTTYCCTLNPVALPAKRLGCTTFLTDTRICP